MLYDAGVLVAAERNDRRVWARHKALLLAGAAPISTAPVVAQVSRTGRQAQLRRLLAGTHVAGFAPEDADTVGALLAEAGSTDVVDAHVAILAHRLRVPVVTGEPDDLGRLCALLRPPPRVLAL